MKQARRLFAPLLLLAGMIGALDPATAQAQPASASSAAAADMSLGSVIQNKPVFFGGLLGLSSINNDVGLGLGYGVEGGFYFKNNQLGLGAFLEGGRHGDATSSFFMGFKGLYRLTSLADGLHAGVILGRGRFLAPNDAGAITVRPFAFTYGVELGYDWFPWESRAISLTGNLKFMAFSPGETTNIVVSPVIVAKIWLG